MKNSQGQLLHNNEEICVIFNACAQNGAFAEGFQPQPLETKESNLNTGISQKKAAQERKSAAKKERDKLYYQKKKEKKITQVKERRKQLRSEKSTQPLTRHVAKKSERRDKENGTERSIPYRSTRKKGEDKATNARKSKKIP